MIDRYKASVVAPMKPAPAESGLSLAEAVRAHPRMHVINAITFDSDAFPTAEQAPLQSALADAVPGVLVIDRPESLSAALVEACAEVGVMGIVSDMPRHASTHELHRIANTVSATGMKILLAHSRRCLPAFRYIKARYLDGSVGEPMLAAASLARESPHRHTVHMLDLFRFIHDDEAVRWVFKQTALNHSPGDDAEQHSATFFMFATGSRGLMETGASFAGNDLFVLSGTKGCIRVRGDHVVIVESLDKSRKRNFSSDPESQRTRCCHELLNDFLRWIAGGAEPELGFDNMSKTLELYAAAQDAVQIGHRVDIQPAPSEIPPPGIARAARSQAR